MTRAQRGHFAKAQVEPKAKVVEFRVSPENFIEVGAELTADHFVTGQFVDATGTRSEGLRRCHEAVEFRRLVLPTVYRSPTEAMAQPVIVRIPKTFRGKKMAGHYGAERVTTQNFQAALTTPIADSYLIAAQFRAPRVAGSCCATRSGGRCRKMRRSPVLSANQPTPAGAEAEAK